MPEITPIGFAPPHIFNDVPEEDGGELSVSSSSSAVPRPFLLVDGSVSKINSKVVEAIQERAAQCGADPNLPFTPPPGVDAIRTDDGLIITFETITPELALAYLAFHVNNRSVEPGHVRRWASQMRNTGVWQQAGDTIVFSKSGFGLDGQHRLISCVLSGETFQVIVVRGVEDDAFAVKDTGRKRTWADAIGVKTKNKKPKADALKLVLLVESDLDLDPRRELHGDLVQRADIRHSYPFYEAILDSWVDSAVELRKLGGPAASWLAFLTLVRDADQELVNEFLDGLANTAATLPLDDPRLLLRGVFYNQSRTRKHSTAVSLGLIIKTWNFWLRGVTVQALALRKDSPFPRPLLARPQQQVAAASE